VSGEREMLEKVIFSLNFFTYEKAVGGV